VPAGLADTKTGNHYSMAGRRYMSNIIYLDEVRQRRRDVPDPLSSLMQYYGLALTRENYLALAYPEGLPEWSDDLESTLPRWARDGG
jgi:hypothetical protein